MSTRYAWDKYNTTANVVKQSCSYIHGNEDESGIIPHRVGYYFSVFISDRYTYDYGFKLINPTVKNFKINGNSNTGYIYNSYELTSDEVNGKYIISKMFVRRGNVVYIDIRGATGSPATADDANSDLMLFIDQNASPITNTPIEWTIITETSGSSFKYFLNYGIDGHNICTPEFIKADYIGTITNNSNIYPSNGVVSRYWYIYKGSDNIDPTAISYPFTIKGGQAITLTTTKSSSNTYGGTITYTYEVQLNGGSWTSIGNSTSLTKSYTVPAGTTTFAARVKAKDNMGFTSSIYTTGNTITVHNNTAPSAPSSISVPSSVQAGKLFTVSWGTSTDVDGNLSGYTLQRSLNGGSYTTIYTGSSRSYQDTIPKSGYTSVTYRVQAYDTDGATSSYRTSSTATVINNVAPVISGSNQNLGVFTYNPPVISYVVTDENNDTVTVTIKLDSSTLDTRTVTLGQTYTVSLDWWDVNTGSHTVTITANDGQGGIATRTYTFTKNSVGQISFNRLHKKTKSSYQTTYIETDSDSIITNNGQTLSERLSDIASKLSTTINTTPTEMVSRHRLHIKLTSEYTIDYLEMYSTNVKVGSSTLEEVLVRLENKVGINNGGTIPSNLNFERWRMKNSSGKYDIIYLEGVSEHIICPCGKSVEERLVAIEAKL